MVRKKGIILFVCILMMLAAPLIAYADVGPKPSVRITFAGIEGETCYGTLLSPNKNSGPAVAWDGRESTARHSGDDYEIWKAFVDYEDADGFYFLQRWWDCSEDNLLEWTYYPPTVFKVLLYFPGSGTFYVSPVCERYAFDSYYTAHLSGGGSLSIEESYEYAVEAASLAARIIMTILLELAVALLFVYREKRQLIFIGIVNIVTQVILNVLLNLVNYKAGGLAFILCYVLLEAVVFVIEALLYVFLLPRFSSRKQSGIKAVCYAFVSNAASFVFGFWLAVLLPGIF